VGDAAVDRGAAGMKAVGIVMLPLSVLPFVAVRGDVIREHDAYLIARNSRAPLAAAPGPPLPGRAPAPPLDSRVRPSIPLGRGATPEEAAGAIFFLCSPWSNFVHGQVLNVTGGQIAGMGS